jgi:hypothetical protein
LLRDVTQGSTSFGAQAPDGTLLSFPGFDAGPGWDAATGLGTPKADALVSALARG